MAHCSTFLAGIRRPHETSNASGDHNENFNSELKTYHSTSRLNTSVLANVGNLFL